MNIYRQMVQRIAAGDSFVLATIVRTAGSSPREVGAKMLVFPDGSISGTIGGGNFEKLVIEDCLTLFRGEKAHLLKTYRFSRTGPNATGMCCGGEADVFMELSRKPDRLIIFGGGHIGRQLAKLASGLNFKITVVDDRQEFLEPFGSDVETVLTDHDYTSNYPSLGKNCYVVIVTRCHQTDKSVLERVIDKGCSYVGMIGSRAKISKMFSHLEGQGVEKALLETVHAPVGLDIGAEGPYEIAVAILAELIAVRRKALKSGS